MIQSLPPAGNDRKRKERCYLIVVNVREGEIDISGHAGYATYGYDIVCSAVSCLFQNLIASIEALTDDDIEYDIDNGNCRMIYKNLSDVSKTLVDSFFIGICMISREFPDNVRID